MKQFALILFSCAVAFAAPTPEPLWPNGAPGAKGTAPEDTPTIASYLVEGPHKTGTAVVVYPGGGYVHLAIDHEGQQIAQWLNGLGVDAFVVKYRLGPTYHHPIQLHDAQRALRTVRYRAKSLGIDPARIGIWGFSAGGHLASTVGTHFDDGDASSSDPIMRMSSRPDFMMLAYPVISFTTEFVHKGSRSYLLGEQHDPALDELLSNEKQVTPQTPPTFIFHTDNDNVVPVENAVLFYQALHRAKVPAELHIFQKGPHGVGLAQKDPALSEWPTLLANWLRGRGLIPAK